MTPAQRAALDTAKAKLREAVAACNKAGLLIQGETGRACLAASGETRRSLEDIEQGQDDDHHSGNEWIEHNPRLPFEELRP